MRTNGSYRWSKLLPLLLLSSTLVVRKSICSCQWIHFNNTHSSWREEKKSTHIDSVRERENVTMTVRTNNRRTDRMQESLEIFTFWWWKFRNFMKMVLQFACILGYLFGSIHPKAKGGATFIQFTPTDTQTHARVLTFTRTVLCAY